MKTPPRRVRSRRGGKGKSSVSTLRAPSPSAIASAWKRLDGAAAREIARMPPAGAE